MKDIRALTSLRGVAAIWVLLFHLELERPVFPAGLSKALAIGRGYVAVDLFFVLSGFVMALTYAESFRTRPFAVAYPDFLLRRIARVMPLNAVIVPALAAIVWLSPWQAGDSFAAARDPWAVLANLFLVQDWGLAPSIDKPAWSVSIEMGVYLLYPFLLALAWSRGWLLALLGGAAGLAWVSTSGHGVVSQGLLVGDIVRGLAGFTFGLLCFRAYAVGRPRVLERLEPAVILLFWTLAVWSPVDLWPILACPAVVLCLAAERGPFARLLSLEPLHYLGRISYSIYLVHYPILGGLNFPAVGRVPYAALAIGLTLLVASATYRWIELPARRRIARLAGNIATVRRPVDTAIVG
ncbi:MAG TPA: acyltransferase [Alphaproteobacteria bacterium]|nr:acyltransferase [Alphaproteobacteria bacterium]